MVSDGGGKGMAVTVGVGLSGGIGVEAAETGELCPAAMEERERTVLCPAAAAMTPQLKMRQFCIRLYLINSVKSV